MSFSQNRYALLGDMHSNMVRRHWLHFKCAEGLHQDDVSLNRHPALTFCCSMIFSENRFPLFGIML